HTGTPGTPGTPSIPGATTAVFPWRGRAAMVATILTAAGRHHPEGEAICRSRPRPARPAHGALSTREGIITALSGNTGVQVPMARKLFIQTHGCQMNEYDSSRMADLLEGSHGLTAAESPEE